MAKQPKPPTQPSTEDAPPPKPSALTNDAVAAIASALASGHTRALLVTHVPAEGQTYDAGRRYELRLLEAKDGQVTVREVKEVDGGEVTLEMPFHVLLSHAEREFSTFLKPEMYR